MTLLFAFMFLAFVKFGFFFKHSVTTLVIYLSKPCLFSVPISWLLLKFPVITPAEMNAQDKMSMKIIKVNY